MQQITGTTEFVVESTRWVVFGKVHVHSLLEFLRQNTTNCQPHNNLNSLTLSLFDIFRKVSRIWGLLGIWRFSPSNLEIALALAKKIKFYIHSLIHSFVSGSKAYKQQHNKKPSCR